MQLGPNLDSTWPQLNPVRIRFCPVLPKQGRPEHAAARVRRDPPVDDLEPFLTTTRTLNLQAAFREKELSHVIHKAARLGFSRFPLYFKDLGIF